MKKKFLRLSVVTAIFAMSNFDCFAQHDTTWVEPLKGKLEMMADSLTKNLKPWIVPKRVFKVERYGAKGNGETLNTEAIQRAVDACNKAGGGVVLFSKGDYVTGTFRLKSNVMIEIKEGARILGSLDLKDYPHIVENHKSIMSEYYKFTQSLIYAEDLKNVGIQGGGEIYFRGERENFPGPQTTGEIKDRPVGIRMIKCNNVVVQNIKLSYSAGWMQDYIACRDLIFDGIEVENHGNFNNDALDPDGCVNVIVRNCFFNTEDDAMCLKGSAMTPSENLLIENSTFYSTCNAFKVGTDTQGDFKNIFLRNVVLGGVPKSHITSRNKRSASTGISIITVDGGNIENMLLQNVTINQSRCPIYIRLANRGRVLDKNNKYRPGYRESSYIPGYLKRIVIENIKGELNFAQGSFISGIAEHMIEDVVIRNMDLKMAGGGTPDLVTKHVREHIAGYPDAHQISRMGLPAYGFYFRHAKNMTFDNVKVTPITKDARPEIFNGGDAYNIHYNNIFIPESVDHR